MKKSKNAFLTTIFKGGLSFLDDFLLSLKKQTVDDFDVVVVNDGVDGFSAFKEKYNEFNIVEIKCSESIVKNREAGIRGVIEMNYDNLIFGDSDDVFSENRVEVSLKILEKYDIVVNDLTLFTNEKILKKNYLSNRIDNNQIINPDFISDFNIFGLSNTAVKVNKLKLIDLNLHFSLIAVDWYLFSSLLLEGCAAIFSNIMTTYYRQYSGNTIGIGNSGVEGFRKKIKVKSIHYKVLSEIYPQFIIKYKELESLNKKLNNENFLNSIMNNETNSPLWWE